MANRGASVGFIDLSAAISNYNGLVQIDQYDTMIEDTLRRAGVVGRRLKKKVASGDPSRWVIQSGVGSAQFTDKRTITVTAQTPSRTEGAVSLKAISGEIKFGLYDQMLSRVMPQGFNTRAQDLQDMLDSLLRLHDQAIFTGTDAISGGLVGDGTTNQYVSLPVQVTTTAITITSSTAVIPTIRTQVAKLMSNASYVVKPSAIYVHPLLIDIIEAEWSTASNGVLPQVEVVPGISVSGIRTAAGALPLIADPYFSVNPSWASSAPEGQTNYPFMIVDEALVEYHHLPGSDRPMLFQMGTTSNLMDDYVAVLFGAPVVKGGDRAHLKGVCQRTTI